MNSNDFIKAQIRASLSVKERIMGDEALLAKISGAADAVISAYRDGRKTLFAGNGGSAADAQHLAAEFVSRLNFDRPGIPSLALNTNVSILTAVSNDYGFERIFARQIEAFGEKGDVFFGISTSGKSPNVLAAFEECRRKGLFSIGLTGERKCVMNDLCNICINVPSPETPRIQEAHILIGHIICYLVEETLFGHLKEKP